MTGDDYDDDGFEQRPNVRWENDFGPGTSMWKRYLMAFAVVAVVILFLGFALVSGSDEASGADGGPNLWLFALVLVLVVVIAVGAEGWAIRLRRRFRGGAEPD